MASVTLAVPVCAERADIETKVGRVQAGRMGSDVTDASHSTWKSESTERIPTPACLH